MNGAEINIYGSQCIFKYYRLAYCFQTRQQKFAPKINIISPIVIKTFLRKCNFTIFFVRNRTMQGLVLLCLKLQRNYIVC